jgi:hypothetical protein
LLNMRKEPWPTSETAGLRARGELDWILAPRICSAEVLAFVIQLRRICELEVFVAKFADTIES